MSHESNTLLLQWAHELMEYYTGTYIERVLQRDIDANDLEALRYHVSDYAAQKAIEDDGGLVPLPEPYTGLRRVRKLYGITNGEATDVS